MRFLYLLILLLPGPAVAQALPELFSVTNVQKGDRLNIRVDPDAKSAVIGQLDRDATGVEVVDFSENGAWALVNSGEGSGWVSRRFLKAEPSAWAMGRLPETLSCFGVEPFWSAEFNHGQLTLKTPDAAAQITPIQNVSDRGFEHDRMRAIQAGPITAVVFQSQCSDGMSERRYGLQAVLSIKNSDRPTLWGCCSVAR